MNILPKKKWHVRTKENMARVRRDEAKAAEQERAILERELTATNEARINLLRKRADDRTDTMFGIRREATSAPTDAAEEGGSGGHVNFFEDLEREERKNLGATNAEYEAEKMKEQREWDSKMGIQHALGEGSHELDGNLWYAKIPLRRSAHKEKKIQEKAAAAARSTEENIARGLQELNRKRRKRSPSSSSSDESDDRKRKKKKKRRRRSSSSSSDDSRERRRHKEKKHKKNKKKKSEKGNEESEQKNKEREEEEKKQRLQKMRDDRLKRERMEQAKTHLVLHPELARKKESEEKKNQPKYNSMFNPHLAK